YSRRLTENELCKMLEPEGPAAATPRGVPFEGFGKLQADIARAAQEERASRESELARMQAEEQRGRGVEAFWRDQRAVFDEHAGSGGVLAPEDILRLSRRVARYELCEWEAHDLFEELRWRGQPPGVRLNALPELRRRLEELRKTEAKSRQRETDAMDVEHGAGKMQAAGAPLRANGAVAPSAGAGWRAQLDIPEAARLQREAREEAERELRQAEERRVAEEERLRAVQPQERLAVRAAEAAEEKRQADEEIRREEQRVLAQEA
ncbi:unnamed protein product, partial [Prorocentrum cordatum]